MTNDKMFAKYITDLCNNPDLSNPIIQACKEAQSSTENDASQKLAEALVSLCGYEFAKEIMNIYDIVYGNGERVLNVDPSYQEAVVQDHPNPKNEIIAFFQAVQPQGNLADSMKSIRDRIHEMKFNPLAYHNSNRIKTEMEQLAETPLDSTEHYKRW